ncbi:MAG: hypothetical protein V8Q95_00880 [Collinsella sp.]
MSLKVGIVGAAGYAGAELIRLVLGHPEFELVAITSNADAGQPLSAVYPSFAGVSDLVFTTHDAPELKSCDAVFLAVPHTAAMAQVPALLAAGVSCFDLSADYRLSDPSVFEAWYAAEHTSPELLKTRAFGLPELFCQDLETAASRPCRRQARAGRLRRLLSHRNEPCCRSCRARGLGGRERPRNRRCH